MTLQDEAIGWLVELRSGETSESQKRDFARWLAADARHQSAWQRLGQAVDHSFGQLDTAGGALAVEQTLARAACKHGQRRQFLRGALCLAGTAVGASWLLRGSPFMPDWPADLHTATATRGRFTLLDGSELVLDARSSADVDIGSAHRKVILRQGQLLVSIAPQAAAPFALNSPHGTVRALGRRLMLRREEAGTLALALQGGLEITGAQGGAPQLLRQGQAAWFDGNQSRLLPNMLAMQASAWEQGMLVAIDQPLGELVAALRPYRHGYIDITPQAARLRVSGNYSLDDSDTTLLALAETLPIELRLGPAGVWAGIGIKAA